MTILNPWGSSDPNMTTVFIQNEVILSDVLIIILYIDDLIIKFMDERFSVGLP